MEDDAGIAWDLGLRRRPARVNHADGVPPPREDARPKSTMLSVCLNPPVAMLPPHPWVRLRLRLRPRPPPLPREHLRCQRTSPTSRASSTYSAPAGVENIRCLGACDCEQWGRMRRASSGKRREDIIGASRESIQCPLSPLRSTKSTTHKAPRSHIDTDTPYASFPMLTFMSYTISYPYMSINIKKLYVLTCTTYDTKEYKIVFERYRSNIIFITINKKYIYTYISNRGFHLTST